MYYAHEIHIIIFKINISIFIDVIKIDTIIFRMKKGFPASSAGKESACNAGDLCFIPGLEGSPGGGHHNPLKYSCLEIPLEREVWRAIVHGFPKSWARPSHYEQRH